MLDLSSKQLRCTLSAIDIYSSNRHASAMKAACSLPHPPILLDGTGILTESIRAVETLYELPGKTISRLVVTPREKHRSHVGRLRSRILSDINLTHTRPRSQWHTFELGLLFQPVTVIAIKIVTVSLESLRVFPGLGAQPLTFQKLVLFVFLL